MRVYEASISYRVVAHIDFRKIASPVKIIEYLKGAYDENPLQESFYVISLNRKNHAIGRTLISLGTLTATVVHPREVFRAAILANAAAIIVSHNHPSGDPAPSAADLHVTRQLREASRALDIILLDHVVVGELEADPIGKGYYSFREGGLI